MIGVGTAYVSRKYRELRKLTEYVRMERLQYYLSTTHALPPSVEASPISNTTEILQRQSNHSGQPS